MAKAGFLSKKSGFMMMDTETGNGFGSDKGSTQRNVDAGFCGLGLQPFATAATTTTSAPAFKSPGMAAAAAAAACLRYPFTSAQWQELERQALIFKYMMASIPVPTDLLIPTARSLSNPASNPYSPLGRGPCFNLRFANGADPEPGRCRRTDGKKWRCSRDVAPDQKYCERHMHRSRPRSRKHVEVQPEINNTPTISSSIPPTLSANSTSSHHRPYPQPPVYLPKPDFKSLPMHSMATATPYKDSRGMDWMVKSENAPILNHDLQQFARNTAPFLQHYQENNDLNSYTDFSTSFGGLDAQNQSDSCCLYLNPELESISEQRQMPRSFIDAWSNARDHSGANKSSSVGGSGKHSPSTLSLSMSSDNGSEDIDQIQMGLGVIDSECNNHGNGKSQPLSWMTPVPWIASPPGGPLGEVLQSSSNISQVGSSKSVCSSSMRNTNRSSSGAGGLNLTTDDWGGSRDTSPRGTAVSSPSGVLHKTLASPSDSSGGNSPTFKAAARNEFALQWMSQNK